jgi:hypothetical protein
MMKEIIADSLKPGDMVYNDKTAGQYEIICDAISAWDINQKLMVYKDVLSGQVYVRSSTEFCEKFSLNKKE